MRNILGFYLMPHPPIIIPSIGKGEEKQIKKTSQACEKVAKDIKANKPDTIIIITPHGLMFQDAISISYDLTISGNLANFNAPEVSITKEIDTDLVNKIEGLAHQEKIATIKLNERITRTYNRTFEIDHGSLIPLYFIEKEYQNYKIIQITYSLLKEVDLYRFGNLIKEAIISLNKKTVIIASGDLSHRLTKRGPYPYSPAGPKFDANLINLLEQGDLLGVMKMDKSFSEEAGECGLRSLQIMMGTLNCDFRGELFSYEGPFGVGYAVMKLIPESEEKNYLEELIQEDKKNLMKKLNSEDSYISLARESIAHYLQFGKIMALPENLSKEITSRKAGAFVSLKKQNYLRGCIGTYLPTKANLGEEIIHNAVSAAVQDPRFSPIKLEELSELEVSVDVLSQPIKATKEELNPKVFGVIVSSGYRKGLLLPNLEGVDTVDEQLQIACEKAGIIPQGNYDIYKFKVERHGK